MADESTLIATAALLQCLGTSHNIQIQNYGIPGANTPAKVALEHEITALILRVQDLEAKAHIANNILPTTPNEKIAPSAFADVLTGAFPRPSIDASSSRQQFKSSFQTRNFVKGRRSPRLSKLGTDELIETLQKEIADQAEQIKNGKQRQESPTPANYKGHIFRKAVPEIPQRVPQPLIISQESYYLFKRPFEILHLLL